MPCDGEPERLSAFLRGAQASWSEKELGSVRGKLARVGVESLPELVLSLRPGAKDGINRRLRSINLKGFSSDTLSALAQAASKLQGRLTKFLQGAEPEWSAAKLQAVQDKLARVGILELDELLLTLRPGARDNIQHRLAGGGEKRLAQETLLALRRHKKALAACAGQPLPQLEDEADCAAEAGAELAREGRLVAGVCAELREFLQSAPPGWSSDELRIVEAKLAAIGICTFEDFLISLRPVSRKHHLNRRLRSAGQNVFRSHTILELQAHAELFESEVCSIASHDSCGDKALKDGQDVDRFSDDEVSTEGQASDHQWVHTPVKDVTSGDEANPLARDRNALKPIMALEDQRTTDAAEPGTLLHRKHSPQRLAFACTADDPEGGPTPNVHRTEHEPEPRVGPRAPHAADAAESGEGRPHGSVPNVHPAPNATQGPPSGSIQPPASGLLPVLPTQVLGEEGPPLSNDPDPSMPLCPDSPSLEDAWPPAALPTGSPVVEPGEALGACCGATDGTGGEPVAPLPLAGQPPSPLDRQEPSPPQDGQELPPQGQPSAPLLQGQPSAPPLQGQQSAPPPQVQEPLPLAATELPPVAATELPPPQVQEPPLVVATELPPLAATELPPPQGQEPPPVTAAELPPPPMGEEPLPPPDCRELPPPAESEPRPVGGAQHSNGVQALADAPVAPPPAEVAGGQTGRSECLVPACATPGCGYRVHSHADKGAYCCLACLLRGRHGDGCEQVKAAADAQRAPRGWRSRPGLEVFNLERERFGVPLWSEGAEREDASADREEREAEAKEQGELLSRRAEVRIERPVVAPSGWLLGDEELKLLKKAFPQLLPRAREASKAWDRRELFLFLQSRGEFDPTAMASKYRRPPPAHGKRVSVVVPTMERRHPWHQQLYDTFSLQRWPDKELIVVETYFDRPSPFFEAKAKEDERVVYLPIKVDPASDPSIGLKRNMCIHLSSGDYIANFDDDDLYAPCYLQRMVETMLQDGSNAITLSSWYIFDCKTGRFGHVAPREHMGSSNKRDMDYWTFGYGFSYVCTRDVALRVPYPDWPFDPSFSSQEDWEFFTAVRLRNLRRQGGCHLLPFMEPCGTALLDDRNGICLHTLHALSTSASWARSELPRPAAQTLAVAALGRPFDALLARCPPRAGSSEFIPEPPRAPPVAWQRGGAWSRIPGVSGPPLLPPMLRRRR